MTIAAMARVLVLPPTRSVTFPPTAEGIGVAVTTTGPVVTLATTLVGPGAMVAVTTGEGEIVTVAVGTAVGTTGLIGAGVGHGTWVALGVGDGKGDDEGVGNAVGAGVGVIVGCIVTLMIVGIGRGVVIGAMDGHPDGSREMLFMVMWLMLAPRSTSAIGRMYRNVPTKQIMARKLNSALYNGLPLQDGPVPDQLLI
jgi:hypothetical protein